MEQAKHEKGTRIVQNAAAELVRLIDNGVLEVGSFLPSEETLAARLAVSRGTVRKAIDLLVAAGTITKRPHSRPIIEPSSKSSVTGNEIHVWVSHPIADEKSLLLVKEISRALRGAHYQLVVREPTLFVGAVVKSDEKDFLNHVLESPSVVGAIIERDPFGTNDDLIAKVVESGKPIVFVDTPPPAGVDADYVGTANALATRTATEFLQKQGHHRIWFVGDSDVAPAIQERIRGYRRAMKLIGAEADGKVIIATTLPDSPTENSRLAGPFATGLKKNDYFYRMALSAACAIRDANPRPTALIVGHDVLAFWLCAFLEGMGISIPTDLSVIGFDWLARWKDSVPDILTTVAQDFEGFGRHAANLLLDRLSAESHDHAQRVLLDSPLVVKNSTTSDMFVPSSDSAPSNRQLSAS